MQARYDAILTISGQTGLSSIHLFEALATVLLLAFAVLKLVSIFPEELLLLHSDIKHRKDDACVARYTF